MTDRRTGGLQYEGLGAKLVEEIPEVADSYRREMEWWGDEKPGPPVIYGDVLTPYITGLLESGATAETIKRAFDLLETLIGDPDVEVQAVAVVAVLERLVGNVEWLRLMKPYTGPLVSEAVRTLIEGLESERDWSA